MPDAAESTPDRLRERLLAAREMALAIAATCESYERAATPATVNRFIAQVELLADVAEAIEVERTVRALDAAAGGRRCCGAHGDDA